MSRCIFPVLAAFAVLLAATSHGYAGNEKPKAQATYVGSQTCRNCHSEEYDRFEKYSKKTHSYTDVLLLKKGLTEQEYQNCLECHTTGYGKPGGFRSARETPRLEQVGCEACHGPGSIHVQTSDPKDIRKVLSTKTCESCHNPERVKAFRFRPMLYGGAH